jgi:hypothetical protein
MAVNMPDLDIPLEFWLVGDPHKHAAGARDHDKVVVWIPRSVRSKQKLFAVYSQALRFPKYFGGNWDAFEECLNDLSWLPDKCTIAVVHEAWPFGDTENCRIYFEILQSVMGSRSDGRTIQVIGPLREGSSFEMTGFRPGITEGKYNGNQFTIGNDYVVSSDVDAHLWSKTLKVFCHNGEQVTLSERDSAELLRMIVAEAEYNKLRCSFQ